MQMRLLAQVLPLFFAERRKDTMRCDTIHLERLLLDTIGIWVFLSYPFWKPLSLCNNSQTLGLLKISAKIIKNDGVRALTKTRIF
jgi:hypothetical protein